MSAATIDSAAIAQKYGAIASTPPPQTATTGGGTDSASIAAKYGALNVEDSGQVTSDDDASRTRQMLVSGLTGMPSPVMTNQEKQQFEQGKAAGAISVPVVAGATTAATAAAPALYDVAVKHLAGSVLPGMEEEAAKQALVKALPHVWNAVKILGGLGFSAEGTAHLVKLFMK